MKFPPAAGDAHYITKEAAPAIIIRWPPHIPRPMPPRRFAVPVTCANPIQTSLRFASIVARCFDETASRHRCLLSSHSRPWLGISLPPGPTSAKPTRIGLFFALRAGRRYASLLPRPFTPLLRHPNRSAAFLLALFEPKSNCTSTGPNQAATERPRRSRATSASRMWRTIR